jgi:type III pantothenate kinase
MMNLVIDIGNTFTKTAVFDGNCLLATSLHESGVHEETLNFAAAFPRISYVIISDVSGKPLPAIAAILPDARRVMLDKSVSMPLTIKYLTPDTLGSDRIAAAAGLISLFSGEDALSVDCGTCIKFDMVDAGGNYLGGSISPGISMRLDAMHHFTGKLPRVAERLNPQLTGNDTRTSLLSGAINGAIAEVNGMVAQYLESYPRLKLVLTGGDSHYFAKRIKSPIFVQPHLVLMGLNKILEYNVSKKN